MRKKLIFAAMLTVVVAHSIPAIAQTSEAGETKITAQAEDKAKNKDIVKEKGKKGKDKKGKDKKGKDKKGKKDKEEQDPPTSGGISGNYAVLFALGAGILLFGGVLLIRRRGFRRTAPAEEQLPDEDRKEGGSAGDGGGD